MKHRRVFLRAVAVIAAFSVALSGEGASFSAVSAASLPGADRAVHSSAKIPGGGYNGL